MSQAAGPAVDQLAAEYANEPVLILEQDVDHTVGDRYGRWWSAYGGGGSVLLPMMMVGSGYQIANGYVNFYDDYKAMIEAEKARPPQAEVTAVYTQEGNHFDVKVTVTNKSGVALSYSNSATVHVLVYEEAKVNLTGRFVRAATSTSISQLADGQTASFDLMTEDISPQNWDNVHVVALVDYYVDAVGHYDMLQAAVATEDVYVDFDVLPDTFVFMLEPGEMAVHPQNITISGEPELTWQMSGGANWFSVTPTQGGIGISPQVSLVMGNIIDGWQEEIVTFDASDYAGTYQDTVVIKAYRGNLERIYLPLVLNPP